MHILGIETATSQTSVAIGTAEGMIACFSLRRERRHVESVAPAIDFACHQVGIEPAMINAVAVDHGPGLYTGLRIGIATAKAIAYAAGIAAIGVCSLDIVAFPARITSRRIVSIVDARRGEVYFGQYRSVAGELKTISGPRVSTAELIVNQLAPVAEGYLIVGDGGRRYAHCFANREDIEIADSGFDFPSAASLVVIAARELTRPGGEEEPRPPLEPLYLRPPDANLPAGAIARSS